MNTFGLLCSLLALSSCNFITKTVVDETARPGDVLPVLEVSDIGDDYPYQLNIGLFRWIATSDDYQFSFSDQDTCLDYDGRFSDSPFGSSFTAAQYGSLLAPLLSTIALLMIYLDTCMVSFPTWSRMNYIIGTLYFLASLGQGLTFLVLQEDRLCGNDECELSGGAGASLAAICSYFLALVMACAGIKGQVKPVCGILWKKMMMRGTNKGGDNDDDDKDDDDDDEKKEQSKERKVALGEETDEEKPVVLTAAETTKKEEEDEKALAETEQTAVADIKADLANMEKGLAMEESLAMEEGKAMAAAAEQKDRSPTTPSISNSQSQPSPPATSTTSTSSPSVGPDASKEQAVENVESSSETALVSSPYTFLDQICCGSPTATTTPATTTTGLTK